MKRVIIVILIFVIGIVFSIPVCGSDVYAAVKVKKGTVYFCIKSGNYTYCTNHLHVFQVDLRDGKVTKLYDQRYTYVDMLNLKGNYLYYLDHGQDVTTGHVYRMNLKTKKEKLLAGNVEDYVLNGAKIYYTQTKFYKKKGYKSSNKVMNLDGSSKKSTKYTVKRTLKESNTEDYYVWNDFNGEDWDTVNYYLATPKDEVLLNCERYYL